MIYLRPLRVEDAKTSWRWRNDAEVWKLTGSKPGNYVSEDVETKWLEEALKRNTEIRYAICLEKTDVYIGNAQFTDVSQYGGQIHIFIGEKEYWGKGIGKMGSAKLVEIADRQLQLPVTYITVHPEHVAVRKIYADLGFKEIGLIKDGHLLMERKRIEAHPTLSVFMMTYNHGHYIEDALESVLFQQVEFPIEIVLGDDYSEDDTRQIIYEYYKKRPDLFTLLLNTKNIGALYNQWQVFDACRGEYIAMLEGDDYWTHPHKLQTQVAYLQQHPETAITFHQCQIKNETTGVFDGLTNQPDQQAITTLKELSLSAYPYTPSVVFRAAYLKKFPIEWRAFMNNRTLDLYNAQFGNIKYFPEVMAVYRKHQGGSWSMVKREATLINQLPVYQFYVDNFEQKWKHHFIINMQNMTNELMDIQLANKHVEPFGFTLKWFWKYHKKNPTQRAKAYRFIWAKCLSLFN